MNIKGNQILLGIILLLVGVLTLFYNTFNLSYGKIAVFAVLSVCGFAFLLLYRTKRKSWSLILGANLVYIALINFPLGAFSLASHLLPPMFFIVPSFIFLVLYFDKGKRGLLLPGSFFLAIGIFIFLTTFDFLAPAYGILFFSLIGASFVFARIIGKTFIGRWAEFLCVACFCIAILQLVNLPGLEFALRYAPQAGSVLIIAASIVIILRAIKKK
ncbi:MAG: hypothetical protein LBS21_03600 [Clostridiales bacterium]|jgi:hypothetical protein|nr:hypothetical protein [Clostridiales bacterium]